MCVFVNGALFLRGWPIFSSKTTIIVQVKGRLDKIMGSSVISTICLSEIMKIDVFLRTLIENET